MGERNAQPGSVFSSSGSTATYDVDAVVESGASVSNLRQRDRALRDAADAYCARNGLGLPALREDSDGFDLVLTLENLPPNQVERLDVLVLAD